MYKKLFDAIEEENVSAVVEYLEGLDKETFPEIVNENKQNPLFVAVIQNNLQLASILLEAGFDPNQKDITELPPFIAAASNGFDEIFDLICLYGPDKNQYNRFGGTALLPSSEKGYLKTVQSALAYGVPVNYQNRLGWSALLEAVILGDGGYLFQDIIRLLLEHGADIHLKDFSKKSSADYALENKQKEVIHLLEGNLEDDYSPIRKLIEENKLIEALGYLQKLEDSVQKDYYLGYVYERLQKFYAARYHYEKGLKEDIQFAFYLAQLYRKEGQVEKALEYFDFDKENAYLQYHKSNYLRELNRHEEAIVVMDELLAQDTERTDYLFHKANSLRSLDRHKEAAKAMEKAMSLVPENDLFKEHKEQSISLMEGVDSNE